MRSIFAAMLLAPSVAFAQPAIPIRELSAPDAASVDQFGSIFSVRQIADRRVLVNDAVRRTVVALDANLANRISVLDSASDGGQSYGPFAIPLIPYLADSTLFPDVVSKTLLVIDPFGRVTRAASLPNTRHLVSYLPRFQSGVDERGNLLYRAEFEREFMAGTVLEVTPNTASDSAPVLRANLETRKVDPIAVVRVQPFTGITWTKDSAGKFFTDGAGRPIPTITVKPLYTIDDWSVLSDGTVAIVRGHDYHVDIIQPDGTKISAPKLPFDFRRLTDEDKQKLVDSARAAESIRRREVATQESRSRPVGGRGGSAGGRPAEKPVVPFYAFQPASDIPDYYPPIRAGASKADADGNLWILPTTSARSLKGELVYDVVNNRGVMTERVRLPVGRSVAGFGRGGVVYLMSKEADNQWTLERTKVRRD